MPLHRLFDPLYVLQLLGNIPHTSFTVHLHSTLGLPRGNCSTGFTKLWADLSFSSGQLDNQIILVINQQSSSSICTICGSSSSSSVYQITVPRQWQSFGLDETISATSGRRRGVVARIPRRQTRPVLQRGGTATTHHRTGSIWRKTGNFVTLWRHDWHRFWRGRAGYKSTHAESNGEVRR